MNKINKKIKRLEKKRTKTINKINKLESKYNYLTSNEGINEFIRKNGENKARLLLIPIVFVPLLVAISSQIIQYTVIPFCIACAMGTIGLGCTILYLDTIKRDVSNNKKIKKLILNISKLDRKQEKINNQLVRLYAMTNNKNNNITQIELQIDERREKISNNHYTYHKQNRQETMASIAKSLASEDINYTGWNKNDSEEDKPIVRKRIKE